MKEFPLPIIPYLYRLIVRTRIWTLSPTFEFWTKSLLCLRKVTSVPEIKARCEFNECCLVSTSLNSCLAASENKDELVFFELKSPDGISASNRGQHQLCCCWSVKCTKYCLKLMRDGGGLLLACVATETKKRVGDISSSNSREFTI